MKWRKENAGKIPWPARLLFGGLLAGWFVQILNLLEGVFPGHMQGMVGRVSLAAIVLLVGALWLYSKNYMATPRDEAIVEKRMASLRQVLAESGLHTAHNRKLFEREIQEDVQRIEHGRKQTLRFIGKLLSLAVWAPLCFVLGLVVTAWMNDEGIPLLYTLLGDNIEALLSLLIYGLLLGGVLLLIVVSLRTTALQIGSGAFTALGKNREVLALLHELAYWENRKEPAAKAYRVRRVGGKPARL